jgi:hypothetical protein
MNTPPRFDQELPDWLEEGPVRAPDEILESVLAAVPSTPQHRAAPRVPRRITPMQGFVRGLGQLVAAVAIVAIAVGGLFILPRYLSGNVGTQPSAVVPTPVPTLSAQGSSPSPSTPPSVSPSPAPSVAPSTAATVEACKASDLAAQVIDWQGAAGTRFGTVKVHNKGTTGCTVSGTPGLQLADGKGQVFLDSATLGEPASVSPAQPVLTLQAGGADSAYLLVGLSNYCGADPAAPVRLGLVLPATLGSVTATAAAGVVLAMAPCNGPGMPATLHVQASWSTTAP